LCPSFTNRSLYTSFQPATCFFFKPWDNRLASIDTNYGLDRLGEAATPALFWDALRTHLLARVAKFTKQKLGYDYASIAIFPAGEAANHPDFLDVVRDVAKEIPRVRGNLGATRRAAEVVVSEDPTYAAARGAAFWMRTRMDWSYCEGLEDEEGDDADVEIVSRDSRDRDGHTEL
jgi:hypothetical protein